MTRWIVNGEDIADYATNVSNSDAGWSTPPKKGENLDIPGQDGQRWVPFKPHGMGTLSFKMWAVGANSDGSMPAEQTRRQLCKQNIERLLSIFSPSANLCEVVRVESAGFRQVNQFPNPANETVLPGGTGYRNLVTNPAAATQNVRPVVTNLAPDPSLRVLTGFTPYTENLVKDPFAVAGRAVPTAVQAQNLWWPTSWETGFSVGSSVPSTLWVAASGVTTAVVSGGYYGSQSLGLDASGSLAANASLGRNFPRDIGGSSLTPGFRCKMARYDNTSTTRSVQVRLSFYSDSAGTTLVGSTSWFTAVTVPSGNTTWATITVAPQTNLGGRYVSVEFRTVQALTAGQGIKIDACSLSVDDAGLGEPAPYFSGNNTWAQWAGSQDRSASKVIAATRPEWTTSGPAFYAYAGVNTYAAGDNSVGFVANREGTGGTQTFELACDNTATVGVPYTVRLRGMVLSGVTATVQLCTKVGSTVTVRGTLSIAGDASPADWQTSDGLTGTVREYQGPTWTAGSGEQFLVRVNVPVRFSGDYAMVITALAVTDSFLIFSGDNTDTTNTQYDWAGTARASKSVISTRRNTSIVTTRHVVNTTLKSYFYAETTCRANGEATAVTLADIPIDTSVLTNGFAVSCTAFANNRYADNVAVKQPQLRIVVKAVDGSNTVLQTYTGATQLPLISSPGLNSELTLSNASPTVPGGTATLRVSVEEVAPVVASTWAVGQVMVLDHYTLTAVPFFDGANGGVWQGTANASASSKMINGPTSYSVTQGMAVTSSAGFIAATSGGAQDIILAADIGTAPAGQYRVGFEVSCTDPVDVYAQVGNLTSMQVEQFLGRLRGNSDLSKLERMQTTIDAVGTFTAIRLRLHRPSSLTGAYSVRMGHTYAYSVTESSLPRINGNYLLNPAWVYGSTGWETTAGKSLSVITTSFGKALSTSGSVLQQNASIPTMIRIPAAAGDQIFTWAKVQSKRAIQLKVAWYNSSDVLISTTIATTSQPDDQLRTVWGWATAPTATSYGIPQIVVSGWKSGDITNLYNAYVAKLQTNRDSGDVDPARWAYFDGSTKSDYQGNSVQWDGAPNASTSSTLPVVAKWWQPSRAVALIDPPYRPIGSVGKVLAFPGFANAMHLTPPTELGAYSGYTIGYTETPGNLVNDPVADQTAAARTVPQKRVANYLSGEISLARNTVTSVVTVRVITCSDQYGNDAQVQWEDQMEGLQQIISWRDLGVGSDWYYIEVEYFETAPNVGYALVADNLLIVDSDQLLSYDYPFYFDGSRSGSVWNGDPHDSTSTYYAGARRCYAEFVEAISPSSMAGGTRAELEVAGSIPGAFWEDLAPSHFLGSTADPDTDFILDDWAGSTARNTECIITISLIQGTAPPSFTVYDRKSGSWIAISYQMALGDAIRIDCAKFRVTTEIGGVSTNIISKVTRGGASPLLPLTPYSITQPPILRLVTPATYDGVLQVDVTGRRKYLTA